MIGVCGELLDDAQLKEALGDFEALPGSFEAVERIYDPGREEPFDLLVIGKLVVGCSCTTLVREIRSLDRDVAIALISHDQDNAYEALRLGVGAFLVQPVDPSALHAAITPLLAGIAARQPNTVLLRCRDRSRRVLKDDIEYVETLEHDQMVHLRDGRKLVVRCSSRDLFAQFNSDPRFFKAGSSYIVNLAHVRSFARDGATHMAGGATVSVPIRLRSAFEKALLES